MGSLTDRTVRAAKPGRHGDGDGLFLVVADTGRRKWVLRYQMAGQRRDMGLGAFPAVGLSTARLNAAHARQKIAAGNDPIGARRAQKQAEKPLPNFATIAADVIKATQERSHNEKVKYQIARHLGPAFCAPLLDRPITEITTLDIIAMLEPVWHDRPEVARKLYPAIRKVFDRGRIVLKDEHGIASFENPAKWADIHAATRWDSPKELSRGSHPALPYELKSREIRVVSIDLPTSWMMAAPGADEFTKRMFAAVNGMLLEVLAATARKDYEDRRRRQAQGITKAKDAGKFKGRAENVERNAGIAAMLRKGVSWNDIQDTTDCSRATIAKIAARVKAAA